MPIEHSSEPAHTIHMKRHIPLSKPQSLPKEWYHFSQGGNSIPTEEQLTRAASRAKYMTDDFYDKNPVGINASAVVYAAMHAFSTTNIPQIEYHGGGAFNEIFILQFSDYFKIAARIPRPDARAPRRIEATVAMMTMARCYRGIPVPEVYAWHSDSDNPVGAPYMLLEWMEGVGPWEQWDDLSPKDRRGLLDELAVHHANFAKPLPFQGMGSIYFAEVPTEGDVEGFDNLSAYYLGPLSRGPTYTRHRGISTWPQTTSVSLRDFWLELWQHEVDFITKSFGLDPSVILATHDHPSSSIQGTVTVGQFLDVAQAVLTLIQKCALPPHSQPQIYEPCFVTTDYAFRNMKMDPETRKITAFLDWDDTYVMPFLLCSRYPEDICWFDGSGERWYATGPFLFLPIDEEGEVEEDSSPEETVDGAAEDNGLETVDDDASVSDGASEDNVSDTTDSNGKASSRGSNNDLHNYSSEDDDRTRRIKDTRLRRLYEEMLTSHDSRFGMDRFWAEREEPLKIQHLLMCGWTEWLLKKEWVTARAAELNA